MLRGRCLPLISFLVLLCFPHSIEAGEKIVLSFGGYDHPMAVCAEQILREAYAMIGITIETKELPPKRYQFMANQGLYNGIVFGGGGIDKKFTNLVKIPVPLGYDEIVVFAKKTMITVKDWRSLAPYSIGVLIGMPEIERNLKGMNIQPVATPQQLFLKLQNERTDVVVFPKIFGFKIIKKMKLPSIHILPGILDRIGLYHYLYKGDKRIRAITEALKKMERSGRIQEITHQLQANLMQ
jgi:polar amino acid transport system substrate-binding protein